MKTSNIIAALTGIGAIAYFLKNKNNETPQKIASESAPQPVALETITSPWRTVAQSDLINYYPIYSFAIPSNFVISEIYAEFHNQDGTRTLSRASAWVAKNQYNEYSIVIYSEKPITLNIRLVVTGVFV